MSAYWHARKRLCAGTRDSMQLQGQLSAATALVVPWDRADPHRHDGRLVCHTGRVSLHRSLRKHGRWSDQRGGGEDVTAQKKTDQWEQQQQQQHERQRIKTSPCIKTGLQQAMQAGSLALFSPCPCRQAVIKWLRRPLQRNRVRTCRRCKFADTLFSKRTFGTHVKSDGGRGGVKTVLHRNGVVDSVCLPRW